MAQKKYVSLSKLQTFLENLNNKFALLTHSHTISDITDYTIDTELSSTSINPVANSALNAEFEAVATAMNALDAAIDDKADASHIHDISEVNELQTALDTINSTLAQKSQVQIITSEATEVLSTLNIHRLSQEEYDEKVSNGTIDENALYLTPDEAVDLSKYATVEQLDAKADTDHNHNDTYYTEIEVDTLLSGLQAELDSHTHDLTNISATNAPWEIIYGSNLEDLLLSVDGNMALLNNNKANKSHTHTIANITNLQSSLNDKVSITRSINGKALSEDIVLSASDVGADVSGSASSALSSANTYTDNAVAQKSLVQFVIWGDDD